MSQRDLTQQLKKGTYVLMGLRESIVRIEAVLHFGHGVQGIGTDNGILKSGVD